ncbi:MAG: flagellar basal body-associated FliL family protein [Pseudomonadota bacterium]
MKAVLPLILGAAGLAGGFVGGHAMRPPAAEDAELAETAASAETTIASEFISLDRQFIVPIVIESQVSSIIVVSLSLEIARGEALLIENEEPKLRDRFLSALFRHAESGAFSGVFTAGPAMSDLRGSLLEAARELFGDVVRDVLVTDIVRQDL